MCDFSPRRAKGIKFSGNLKHRGQERFLRVDNVLPARREFLGGDIRALIDHETRLVLGRNKSGTLELREDSHGLWGRVKINPNDQDAANLYERVKRGEVDQCSFGCDIVKEDTEVRDDGSVHWTIREVKLYEVSVVTFPAYTETSVSARKRDFEEIQKRETEKWRDDMKRRLKGENHGS